MVENNDLEIVIDATATALRQETNSAMSVLDQLDGKVSKVQSSVNEKFAEMGKSAQEAANILSAAFGVGLSVVGIVDFTHNAIEAVAHINDLSERTGIAASTLQSFSYIAQQNGTDIDQLSENLDHMSKTLGDAAANAGGSAAKAFNQLGLSVSDLINMTPEQQFEKIADSISNLGTQSEKSKALMDIFGRSGAELAGIVDQGSGAIQGMIEKSQQLGLVLSNQQVKTLAEFNNEYNTMNQRLKVLAAEGFLALDNIAKDAADNTNILFDRLNKVSLAGLSNQAGDIRTEMLDLKQTIDQMTADLAKPGGPSFFSSTSQASLDLAKNAYAGLQQQLNQVTTTMESKLPGAVKTGSKSLVTFSQTGVDALAELNKQVDDLLINANKQIGDIGLTDVARAGNDADAAIAKFNENVNADIASGKIVMDAATKSDIAAMEAKLQLYKTTQMEAAALKELYGIYQQTETPLEKYTDGMKQLNADNAQLQAFAASHPLADLSDEFLALNRQSDLLADSLNRYAPLFQDLGQTIQSDLQTSFSDLFEFSNSGFKSMLTTWEDSFEQTLAKLATLAIADPVIVPIVQSLGSSFGISQTGIDNLVRQLGGSAGVTNSGTAADSAFSMAGLFGTSLLGNNGISQALDSFGAKYLGVGSTEPVTDASGNVVGSLTTDGLSKSLNLGNALGGFAGSEAGNLVFGNTGMAGTVASAAGGLGGAALATGTGAIATELGGALGSWAGPVGAAIGAFAGEGLTKGIESLFGGKPSDMTEAGEANLNSNTVTSTSGATSGKKFSQANSDTRDAVLAFATGLSSEIALQIGDSVNEQLTVKIGNRDGDSYTLWGGATKTFSNATDLVKSLTTDITALYASSGKGAEDIANLNTAIGHIDFSNTTTALSDIQFALNFSHLGDAAKTTDDVQTAVANLDSTFAGYLTTTQALGLSVSELNADQAKQLGLMQNSYMQSSNDSSLSSMLPGFSDLLAENDNYKTAMQDAQALSLSQSQISTLNLEHELKIKELLEQNNAAQETATSNATTLVSTYGNISTSMASFITDLQTGTDSLLSPVAQLAADRSQIASDYASYQGGDTEAGAALEPLLSAFIQLSQSVNGGDADYAQDQQYALSVAEGTKSISEQQLDVEQGILDAANSATSLLESIAGKGADVNANAQIVKDLAAGWNGLTTEELDSIFESAGVNVAAGSGARTNFLSATSNSGINQQLDDIFHALGAPGFALGTEDGPLAGGVTGQDSIPSLLMPGERVLTVSQSKMLESLYANQASQQNDNSDVIEELGARLDKLTFVVNAMRTDSNNRLDSLVKSNSQLALDSGIERSRSQRKSA